VCGTDYSDLGDWSGHTRTWEDPDVVSHSAKSSAPKDLIAMTLVDNEEPVVATRLLPSSWSDRQVQVGSAMVVITSIGLTTWALAREDGGNDVMIVLQSVAPSMSPSLGPEKIGRKVLFTRSLQWVWW